MDNQEKRAQAFKVGFLLKVASLGITPTELFKKADGLLDRAITSAAEVPGKVLGAVPSTAYYGSLIGAGLPLGAGAVAGSIQSRLEAPSEKDLDILRMAELEATYKRLTNEARVRMKANLGSR